MSLSEQCFKSVVERVGIETGVRERGFIEVASGLTAGDLVVAKAGSYVSDGDRINPVPVATN